MPFALSGACTPLTDLDAAGRGAGASGGASSSGAGAAGVEGHGGPAAAKPSSGGTSGEANSAAAGATAGNPSNAGGAPSQPSAGAAGSASGGGGVSSDPQGGAGSGPLGELSLDLPNDQPNSPVQGEVACFEASYSGLDSFEVLTPTANYVILRDHGSLVSITDALSEQSLQWIGYSDYRPRRAAGVLSNRQLPEVATTLDSESLTLRHVRLRSESADGDWAFAWDFYATQATLTITRAPAGFGFTYRGAPGGQLDDADRLVFASGEGQSAENSFAEALPGTTPWLYFADRAYGSSLFLIQHTSDELPDRYDSLDGDSAALLFGDGKISNLPNRFSLGLVDSTDHLAVTQRVEFVIAAVR